MAHVARQNFSINNSTSKQQFAFSKASRFHVPKQNTNCIHYEIPGGFGSKKGGAAGFGIRESRFGYEEIKKQ